MSENPVLAKWNEIKTLMTDLELDVVKNANGTAAAGVRARKGLREAKSRIALLVKDMVALDKANKANKTDK